jgi:hypothetical protein
VSDRVKHLRNAGIIVLLALAVWQLPQGALAGRTISNLLSVILLAGLAFFGYRMYMERGSMLHDLPERQRIILYGSTTLLVFTLVATTRMWNSSGGLILLWFALIGLAIFGFARVIREYRQY